MQYLVLGFGVLALLLLLVRWFVRVPAGRLAQRIRLVGGIGALILATLLSLIGWFAIAAPLAGFGLMLLTRRGPFGGGKPSAGQTSSVETEWLAMELDHDTGAMRGRVLKGRFAGRELAALGQAELMALAQELLIDDPPSAQLLEAYLDRRFPNWREAGAGDHKGAAGASGDGGGAAGPDGSAMTREEALAILGLEEGASEEEIRKAHRTLMKRLHPDHGGSTYLASKLNEAKERLLGSA